MEGNSNAQPFEITIWYFSTRKEDASNLASIIKEGGNYFVNLHSAENRPDLQHVRTSPSYMFFQIDEFNEAMKVRELVEKNTGKIVNTKKSTDTKYQRSIRIVLTESNS